MLDSNILLMVVFLERKTLKLWIFTYFYFRITCDADRCAECEETFGTADDQSDIASTHCARTCAKCEEGDFPEDEPGFAFCELQAEKGSSICRYACWKRKAVCSLCALLEQCNLFYPYGKKK